MYRYCSDDMTIFLTDTLWTCRDFLSAICLLWIQDHPFYCPSVRLGHLDSDHDIRVYDLRIALIPHEKYICAI